MKDNQLFNGSVIFFLIIMAGLTLALLSNRQKGYEKASKDVFYSLEEHAPRLTYYDMLYDPPVNLEKYLLVDTRPREKATKTPLSGWTNIPEEALFHKDTMKMLKSKAGVLVCSKDEQASILTVLVLRSMGVDNARMVAGNCNTFKAYTADQKNHAWLFYHEEKKQWNYPVFFRGSVPAEEAPEIPEKKLEPTAGC